MISPRDLCYVVTRSVLFVALLLSLLSSLLLSQSLYAQTPEPAESGKLLADSGTTIDSMLSASSDSGIPGIPAFTMTPRSDGGEDYSVTIQILAIMTALTHAVKPRLYACMSTIMRTAPSVIVNRR